MTWTPDEEALVERYLVLPIRRYLFTGDRASGEEALFCRWLGPGKEVLAH